MKETLKILTTLKQVTITNDFKKEEKKIHFLGYLQVYHKQLSVVLQNPRPNYFRNKADTYMKGKIKYTSKKIPPLW